MRKIYAILAGVILVLAFNISSQTTLVSGFNHTAVPVQSSSLDSFVQVAADSQGLSQVAPADLPRGATYWWVMANGSAVPAPCLPGDLNGPVYQITDAQFLVDTTGGQVALNSHPSALHRQTTANTVATVIAAHADAVVNLINQIQARDAEQQMRSMAMAMGIPSFGGGFGDGGGYSGNGYTNNYVPYTFDTNGLWLGNPTVSNGVSYVNLNNATNQVYAILTTTNLLGSWQVETIVWPTTNTSVMPFTVQNGDRQILFFRAMDWTGVTENGNTVPDWWLWQYFGTTALSDTNLDSQGNTLLSDYQNGTDPNIIRFSIEAASQYVNTTTVNAQLNITAGTPSYYALLVNGQTTTNWLPLTTVNLPVNLGSTDGVYNIAIGLRGLPANATQTWDNYSFTLDRVAPKLSLTNPAGGIVIKPYLQLQGFADKPLASLSYDISNEEGVVSNQDAFVTDQSFDTNKFDFTTNYFQAYDMALATNVNNITLRVTDRAGNTTTTNFNVVLDYSSATNPPVVNLIWPQDGMAVNGTNITIRGTMSDETGTIAVQTVDGNGNTNTVTGLVERNRMFWIENVPLNGTNQNQITLQATDAAGNVTVTNFTVLPSDLVLTIDSTPTGDALYQGYGNVYGSVSDQNATVTVNGVTVTNDFWTDDGVMWHWEADNVPICGQGTATFDAVAVPAGQNTFSSQSLQLAHAMGSGSPVTPPVNVSAAVEMGSYVAMTSYHGTEIQDYESPNYYSYSRVKKDMLGNPVITPNGQWSLTDQRSSDFYESDNEDSWPEYDHENYQWSQFTPVTAWEESDSSWGNSYNGPAQWPDYGLEYELVQAIPHEDQTWGCASCGPNYIWACVHHYFADKVQYHWDLGSGSTFDLNLTAKTQVKLFTGGKAQVSRKNLFQINASASAILRPPVDTSEYGCAIPWWSVQSQTIAPTSLTVAGKSLGTDGNLWLVLPDNSPGIDVTVKASGKKHYDANTTAQKYTPTILANSIDLSANTPIFCVGQNVTFTLNGLPMDQVTSTFGQWYLPTKYVNEAYAYSSTCTSYRINSSLLANTNQTSCWFYNTNNGHVSVGLYLDFTNGQSVIVTAKGNISVYRPKVSNFQNASDGGHGFSKSLSGLTGVAHWFAWLDSTNAGNFGVTQIINCNDGQSDYYTAGYNLLDGNSEIYGEPPDNGSDNSGPKAYDPSKIYTWWTEFKDTPFDPYAPCANMKANFKDYIRFQPNGGIFVTIATVEWHMNGDACLIGDIAPNDLPPASNPVDSDIFPLWELIRHE